MHHLNNTTGTLTLIGSGEMTPGMARAHRFVMGRIDGKVRPAFLDTPAGFELNHQGIAAKAVDYFREQFDLPLEIASFPNAASATPLTMERAMRTLRRANYIFAGPGSPTYAVRNLRNTPVFETIVAKLGAGAHVAFASAAVLSLSRFTIPVYEIYKVGEDPRWTEGLDLLGRFGFDLALVPHWNNASGGNHDTTRCFIGQPRFDRLRAALPPETVVLGVDEYTACTLCFDEQVCEVFGAGSVTVLRADGERTFTAGQRFPFEWLHQPGHAHEHGAFEHEATYTAFRAALDEDADPAHALGLLHGLMEQTRRDRAAGASAAESGQVELMIREMTASLAEWLERREQAPRSDPDVTVAPFVEALIDVRRNLRAAKQWAAADQLRDALTRLGIALEDTPQGTQWRRVVPAP